MSNIDNANKLIVISGAGYKQLKKTNLRNIFNNKDIKPNIGASCALELVRNGYNVFLLSRSEDKLANIKNSIDELFPKGLLKYKAINLLDIEQVSKVKKVIPRDKEIHLVHCMGLSAGAYKLPNDNPYLSIEKTPPELPILEYEAVVKSLLLLVRTLLSLFKKQEDTRIVVVSSMSGIRSFPLGFSHTSAKAGLHHATRALTLELNKKNIFVTEINPGIVNTGMYDPPQVRKAVVEVGKAFGYKFTTSKFPQMEPNEVAKAVLFSISSNSHVLQINIVPKGQYPNIGS